MPQVINSNILSLTTQRNLNRTQSELTTAITRLSSGLRVNSAKDDAAGLGISDRFSTQIRGLDQAVRNANDGVSFSQVAEGALSTISDALQRVRELAVQSINDTNSPQDRQSLNNEVQQLLSEVNRISNATQFNGQDILDGSLANLTFQIGANQNQTLSVTGVDARGQQLGARVVESGSISRTDLDALIAADNVTINGAAVDLSGLSAGDSITDVISRINDVFQTSDVLGAAESTTTSGDLAYTSNVSAQTVSLNGVDIAIGAGATRDDVVASINSASDATGVTASAGTGSDDIVFTSDGRDIELTDGGTNGGSDVFGGDEDFFAGIVFSGDVGDAITLAGSFDNTAGISGLGTIDDTFADEVVNGVNVLTSSSSNDALRTIDFALSQVSNLRSEFGAIQNRLESTIANLQIGAENFTAARSRIIDADFAQETARFTRAQILQQAGISQVAQANSLPQLVLGLLG
ncbi:MAG: flagellin N-terminal helical domain-containing protein [Gammaproteobacteria bacterium]|jgi:flagellin